MHNAHLDHDEVYLTIDHEESVDIDAVRDQLQGVLEAVYRTGNVANLEEHLDELCAHLDMDIIKEEPKVKSNQSSLLNWYLGYQRATLDYTNGGQ